MPPFIPYIPLIFPLIGLFICYKSFQSFLEILAIRKKSSKVIGIVTDFHKRPKTFHQRETYSAKVSYEVLGKRYCLTSKIMNRRRGRVGRQKALYVDTLSPSRAYIKSDLFFKPFVLLGMGGGFLFLGTIVSVIFLLWS